MNLQNAWYRLSRKLSWGAVRMIPGSWLGSISDQCLRARLRLQERERQIRSRKSTTNLSHITSHDGRSLTHSVLEKNEPWSDLSTPACKTPGMLTEAEKKYYLYITQFANNEGAIVEVGTWMGMSTFYLASGLKQNPRFEGKLQCFDDYVWRETSMGKWVENLEGFERPEHLGSFMPNFQHYLELGGHEDRVVARRYKVADYYGNEALPQLEWNEGPIEMAVIDCGRDLSVNLGWYEILSPAFVPNRTLVVMQDWQNHKRVPEVFWENTKVFTDGRGEAFEMIHEVRSAGIATFLYRGKP